MGADSFKEIMTDSWRCTGGIEYGGFHPEVINHGEQCQLCSRRRHEQVQSTGKKKKVPPPKPPQEKSALRGFLVKQILPKVKKYKYGLLAVIASTFGFSNEAVREQLINVNQFLETMIAQMGEPQPEQTPTPTPTPTSTPSETPTPEVTETPVIEPEPLPEPSVMITLRNGEELSLEPNQTETIDPDLGVTQTDKIRRYPLKIMETTMFDFQLGDVEKPEDISIAIVQYLEDGSKKFIHHSHDGGLSQATLEPDEYTLEVILMVGKPKPYPLTVTRLQ